jgi:hypothetical protein
MRSQTIGFYIKTLKNPIAKNQGLPPLLLKFLKIPNTKKIFHLQFGIQKFPRFAKQKIPQLETWIHVSTTIAKDILFPSNPLGIVLK